ncbi:MAG TPA: LPS assembly lipoprotein LptE [Verrucomicrobiae bacterium]|nr:LPS assembly lipoprotein LptE [Verrucomicrobiae bacterium]
MNLQRQSLSVSNLWGINLFSIVTLALACFGCAGYRLGPTSVDTRGKSIQINFFENQTLEPRLVEAVNHALRKNVQHDGTYRLNTRGDGDVIVNGVIVGYLRQGLSFQPTDTLTIRDYQVTLVTKITAVERGSGKVILDREVTGRTTVRSGSDLPSAERQALSLLADDLAKNATTLLAEGKW